MSRRGFRRSPADRLIGLKTLIVCEGDTEEGYFNAIRIDRRVPPQLLRVLNPPASDPHSLVSEAINAREDLRREKSWTMDDTAWAVFDGDEHIENDPDNWLRAVQKARANEIRLVISNPSFELWYLLHFQAQNAHIHRDDARRRVEHHILGYEKSNVYYPNLEPFTDEAATRANDLRQRIERDDLDEFTNPRTNVFELVEHIRTTYVR